MKASREQAAESRERILDVASKRFRERGFDGVGVADLMHDAGLTHGGFYGHIASKDEFMAEDCAHALSVSVRRWQRLAANGVGNPVARLARSYLSARHRDEPGAGCALATLGADVARRPVGVRHAITGGLRSLVDVLANVVAGRTKAARRRKALALYASMVGAMVLARAVDDGALSKEILDAVTASVEAAAVQ